MVLFCGYSMSDGQEKILVGVIGRAHGVHGAVRVCTENDGLLRSKKVYLGSEQDEYSVRHSGRNGRFVTLELEGVDDRDQAAALTGLEVRIDRSSLKKLKNIFYVCDLIGLSICDESGHVWGRVDAVMPSGAHDLLRYVRPNGGTGLVPFVSAYVGQIDMEAGTIQVQADWMSELDAVYEQ